MFYKLLKIQWKLYDKGCVGLRKFLNRFICLFYHCDIPYSINFEKINLCHRGFGIVINPNASIGEGTYIQHGVTIGAMDDKKNIEAPKIGCNCYIGAKAIIIGGVFIGDNAKVGAGAVVVSDVPEGTTAVGVPAEILFPKKKK